MYTQTRRRQDCLHPFAHLLLMVFLDTPETYATIASPDGLSLNAAYINGQTRRIVRDTTLHFQGDVRLHFFSSTNFPGWFYLLQYSSYFQTYGCSCADGKIYQRTDQPCEHMQQMLAREVSA